MFTHFSSWSFFSTFHLTKDVSCNTEETNREHLASVTFPHRGTSDIVYVVYVYATRWKYDTKGSTRKHQYDDKGWDKLEVEENPNYGKLWPCSILFVFSICYSGQPIFN